MVSRSENHHGVRSGETRSHLEDIAMRYRETFLDGRREHRRSHHRTRRRARRRARGVLGAVLVILLSGLRPPAVSASDLAAERKHSQGRQLQAIALPDLEHRWLQGGRLIAHLDEHATIEILRFAGEMVHGLVRDEATGYQGPVELHVTLLAGMRWTESRCDGDRCVDRTFRIVDVQPPLPASESKRPDGSRNPSRDSSRDSDAWLYRVQYRTASDTGPGSWLDVCESRGDEPGEGLFVNGQWSPDGSWSGEGYTFSCLGGVIARCAVEWGYEPWKTLEPSGQGASEIDVARLHLACTRAARAEYCGDGVSYTLDGVMIDMFDGFGINRPDPDPGFVDESSWDESGALRLHHARVPGMTPAAGDLDRCLHRAGRPRRGPPLIRVRSKPDPRRSGQKHDD